MKEFKTIIEEYRNIDATTKKAALATVVKVRGSSYRSPGARMLITDDGKWVGSISGGCLEGDALRKARQVISTGVAMTVTYDTREESNQNLGIGLGCNGVIDVLIEPLDPGKKHDPIKLFSDVIGTNQPVVLATVFDQHAPEGENLIAAKFLLTNTGDAIFDGYPDELSKAVKKDALKLFETKKSEVKSYGVYEIFVELIQPGISLIIFGGGFDARPVSALAKSLGWNVSVTDECVAHIAPVFFPAADKLSLCDRTFVDRDFTITPYTACVLMSHNYEYDRDVLKKLLNTRTPYIGILGPRKRFDKMQEEFKETGLEISKSDLRKIHSPIGLDIGAETPDEIALSIISEIQGKFSSRSGGHLKYREGPIHERDLNSDQVFKQVYLGSEEKSASKSAG